jgi:hypothetical protein
LHLAEKRTEEVEKRLEGSEKARAEAERKVASVGDLRDRLNAAETTLSEKEEQIAKWEVAIIARLDTQSARVSSNIFFPFAALCLFAYTTFIFLLKSTSFFSRKNW